MEFLLLTLGSAMLQPKYGQSSTSFWSWRLGAAPSIRKCSHWGLNVEPRLSLSEYIPGVLPLSYLALKESTQIASLVITLVPLLGCRLPVHIQHTPPQSGTSTTGMHHRAHNMLHLICM